MKAKNYYKKFVNDRDLALEKILRNARLQIADVSRGMFLFLTHHYLSNNKFSTVHHQAAVSALQISDIVKAMRRKAWLLTVSSEAEVMKRIGASDKSMINVRHCPVEILNDEFEAGGTIHDRVFHYLNKIVRKLDNLKALRELQGKTLTPDDIKSCLPRPKFIRGPRMALTNLNRLQEANEDDLNDISDDEPAKPMVMDFITEDQWNDILDDYKNEYIPQTRGPDTVFDDKTLRDQGIEPSDRYEDVTYGWEIEQDVTHDFVQTVRMGQSDAANEMGVTDMIWMAVLDSHTDECCDWRDGLLTSEIEAELNKGGHDGEECDDSEDGTVPPIHFNCRCALAPATDDLPDPPESNIVDFEDWLNS